MKLPFPDVKKSYVNGLPKRSMYIRLPPEMGMGKGVMGKLKRCIYGTRDAGAIWEATFTQTLLDLGFVQGKASPCTVRHPGWGVVVVVHGDGFTALCTSQGLDLYEAGMNKAFAVKSRGSCRLRGG